MFCPNYRNREVFDGFNEMIEAFGGKPMTEEEFRSAELRNERTGLDFAAMEAAYTVYDKNGGNFLDFTPQGDPSFLFQTLLDIFDGNRSKAIIAKSNVYSDNFLNWFGDWVNSPRNSQKFEKATVIWAHPASGKTYLHKQGRKDIIDFDSEYKVRINKIMGLPEGADAKELRKAARKEREQEYHDLIMSLFDEAIAEAKKTGKKLLVSDIMLLRERENDLDIITNMSDEKFIERSALRGETDAADKMLWKNNINEAMKNVSDKSKIINTERFLSEDLNDNSVSKVVDENGEPKVVYHGSKTNITIFDSSKSDARQRLSKTIKPTNFFSDDRTVADFFAITEKQQYAAAISRSISIVLDAYSGEDVPEDVIDDDIWTESAQRTGKSKEWCKQFWENEVPAEYKRQDEFGYTRMKDPNVEKQKYQVFLNMKNPVFIDGKGERADKVLEENKEVINNNDEVIILNVDETVGKQETTTDYLVRNSNQIKSAVNNNGEFSTDNNDINHVPVTRTIQNGQQFENASITFFTQDVVSMLQNGENVSSGELISQLLSNEALSVRNTALASILQRHEIPVKLDGSIGEFVLASTRTNKKTGKSVILLNPDLIGKVTKGYLGEAILHEVVHAVTVSAINNPVTKEQKRFVELNRKVLNRMRKLFPQDSSMFNDVDLSLYALKNEKEFAAVFITDDIARANFYRIARQIDLERNGKFLNTFKNFINSIVNLFVNKNVFNTAESQLKVYQNTFINYLQGIQIEKVDKVSKKAIKELYDSIDPVAIETQSLIEKMKYVQSYADAVEQNNIITLTRSVTPSDDRTHTFEDIVQKLQIRVNALRTSDLKQSEKNKYINDTKTQIDMFKNQQTAKYIAIASTLRQVVPQVLKDVRELKHINMSTQHSLSGTEYMYQMHSNIGMYNNIAETMLGILNQVTSSQQIIDEYNNGVSDDQRIGLEEIEELKKTVQDLSSVTAEGVAILKTLRDRTAKDILRKKAQKEGAEETMEEYLNTITENPTFDDNISYFEMWLGAMDSASNEALRALSSIVNRSLKKADKAVIDKATTLLELQANLKRGESVVDLYETDKGLTTGYLIRKLNYGKFYKAYDKELIRINKAISSICNIVLEDTNRVAPDIETELSVSQLNGLGLQHMVGQIVTVRQAWNELKNKWLNDNCERKYNKKYYDAWNKVPQVAKDALDSINTEIASILSQPGVLGEDGYNHYENLSDEDWNTLQDLWIQKKLLRSDYDMFGNKKQEGSTEYKIAKSLQQLNKDLYGDTQQKIKKDTAAWQAALKREIQACGGTIAYNKWKAKESNHGFDVERFTKWHIRNSRLEFKKDANGNAIVFQDIEAAMQGMKVDYGPEYNDLKDQANELLKPYRAQNGEINAAELPEAVKNMVNEIYSKQYEIRQQVLSNNPALSSLAKKYKEVFDQFIIFEDTEYYKQIKKQIAEAATDENGQIDINVYDALLEAYGRFSIDYETGVETGFQPYRWLQRMEAIDIDKYMEYQPGDAWTEKVDNEDLLNPNFDDSQNTAFVPKKSLYDNSKKFAKIENSPTLKALYDEVVNTMHESNSMQSNRLYADDFLLPQITGSLYKRMKNHSAFGKLTALTQYIGESLGIGYNPEDFSQIGSTAAADEYTSEGELVVNDVPLHGQYPDGRTFHIMPQYYTRRMEDPSRISSDLVNILTNYYKMSQYYKERVAIKDDCETIVDFLEQRQTKSSKTRFKKGKNKDKSRLFNAAEKFLEMNLYDMRRSSTTFNIGPIELQWSKTVGLWKTWTTRRNLGMNPKVALTGLLTSLGVHMLNIVSGQNYGHEGLVAFKEVLQNVGIKNLCGAKYLGNPLSKDAMMLMTEHYGIAGQAERKWEGTNRNRFIQVAYKNSIFGMLSIADFLSKTIIMTSILMNHHYVDGKFVSKDDIRNSRHLYNSKEEFNAAMNEWRKGPSLYSLLKEKNGRLHIDENYRNAFEQTDDVIKNRVQKTAEYADGMATDLQRAAITQSVVGALVLIHKQYLPLIIQRYFGKRVYDYDRHQWTNGVFRTFFQFIGQIMQNNLLAGIGAGAFTGVAFLGTSPFVGIAVGGATIGAVGGAAVRAYGAYKHKHGAEKKTLKQIWNEEFNDFSTKRSTALSYSNRSQIKEVCASVIGYKLLVQPIVGLVCSIADEDDDDKWWLQLLAYVLRAFEWEFYTAFRTDDMLNNMKSPSAATSVLDATESFFGSVANTVAPQGNFLFDPSQTWDDWENIFGDNTIQKGAYEGWQPWERDFVKGTAFHNLYEQIKNSKAKRRYQENQIMRIKKPE